jgi:5'(3')-deoxyribonucleotidase
MEAEKIALFDLDGSLANFDGAMRRDLRLMRFPGEPEIADDTKLHDLEAEFSYIKARMDFIKSKPGWWRKLPRIDSGFVILREAQRIGYHIDILTKASRKQSQAWMEKVQWCEKQPELAEADIHLTMNKGLVYGKLLFDDFPDYMTKWLRHRPRGLGIMPVTAYNGAYSQPNVVKYDGTNVEAVVTAMQIAYDREEKEPLILS